MLLSELEFGSFLAYSPHGTGETARESQRWCKALKDERHVRTPPRPMSRFVVERLQARIPETPFATLFGDRVAIVPVPKSSLTKPGDLWVPYLLARALVHAHLGADVYPCLRRRHSVRKSATAAPAERARPSEHYESLAVERALPEPDELLLVDDVITRGATLLGCASRLRESFPRARVRAFAFVRTISDSDEFESMFAPVLGHIVLRSDSAFRDP